MTKTMRIESQTVPTTRAQSAVAGDLLTSGPTGRTRQAQRTQSIDATSSHFKPQILESKVSTQTNFFQLSDGFKRVFSNDTRDQKMVVPVVGYGGHRRGDRSQNLFGKSFRDTTIQSKFIEREFRK